MPNPDGNARVRARRDGPITLYVRRDRPEQDGRYLVVRRGARGPLLADWSDRDGWRSGGRRLEVVSWAGPILFDPVGL